MATNLTLKVNFSSTADNQQVIFSGQKLTGEVHFTLLEEQSLKRIEVKIFGGSHVKWEEYGSYGRTDVEYSTSYGESSETYIEDTEVLWRSKQAPEDKLGPGNFILPFQLDIPAVCPSSFKGKWGDISYILTAKIDKGELIHQDQTIQMPIRVLKLTNPNLPQFSLPTQQSQQMSVTGWCCVDEGEIQFTARLPHTGACIGHNLPLTVDVINNSKRATQVFAIITRNITFRASTLTKEEGRVLVRAHSPDIEPYSEFTWNADNLVISAKEEPTIEGSQIIRMEDILTVKAYVPNWSDESSPATFPIIIGNVPIVNYPPTVS